MGVTAFEGDLLIAIASTLMAIVGWVAVRQEMWGRKVVRLETKLENGLAHELATLGIALRSHIDGEEERIMRVLQRDPRSRTRRHDRKLEPED